MSHLIFNIDINILKYVKTIKISFIANDFLRRLGFGEIPTVATSACISSQIPLNPIVSENSVIGAFLDSLNTLFWKGKHFKDTMRSEDQVQDHQVNGKISLSLNL
uniref:Uncharacterized protein n=1 Tax=Theileria parva TaxID=5875 RepID=Q4N7S8_THEPA|eukprot:XP_766263.1 hypothetical protein [Theileria parva strain Muguga]